MAAAYAWSAGDGDIPPEIEWQRYGDRFGYVAVFGREPSPYEMRCMVAAQNVAVAYEARTNAENWAKWSKDNPEMSELLSRATIEAVRLGLVENGE